MVSVESGNLNIGVRQPRQCGLYIKGMRKLILLLTITTLLTVCQHSPYAGKYTVVEPTDKDVTGTYEFDFQTVDYSIESEKITGNKPKILINPNKTYKIDGLPYFKELGVLHYEFNSQITLSGTWTIVQVGSVDFGNGNIKKHWGLRLESAPNELQYAGLIGIEKPEGIVFGFGDPDEGDVMMFNKK